MATKQERHKIFNKLLKKYKMKAGNFEKGGELLGQGAYGCIFDTDMYCYENEKIATKPLNVKTFTKIFDDIAESDIEWQKSKLIAKIDPNYNNFVYAYERCKIGYNELKKDRDFDKCKLPLYENQNNLGALKMINGGIDYDKYLEKHPRFDSFLKSIVSLFEGLVRLNNNGLVHQDIKITNILYDEQNNRWRYIDYGIMKNKSEIYEKGNTIFLESQEPNAFPLPPDYRIFYNTRMSEKNIEDIEYNIYNFKLNQEDDKTLLY